MNEELLKRLDTLTEQLGVGGSLVWDALLRQAHIDAYGDAVMGVVLPAIACACFYLARRENNRPVKYDEKSAIVVISSLGGVVLCTIALCQLRDSINGFLNPQVAAMNLLKGLLHK